jgi:hypothetical protein
MRAAARLVHWLQPSSRMKQPQTIDVVALGAVTGGTTNAFDLNVYRKDKTFAQQYEMRCLTLAPGKYFCTGSPGIADNAMP